MKLNKRGVLDIHFIIEWGVQVILIFIIIGIILPYYVRLLPSLDITQTLIGGLVIVMPLWGLIQSVVTKAKEPSKT